MSSGWDALDLSGVAVALEAFDAVPWSALWAGVETNDAAGDLGRREVEAWRDVQAAYIRATPNRTSLTACVSDDLVRTAVRVWKDARAK